MGVRHPVVRTQTADYELWQASLIGHSMRAFGRKREQHHDIRNHFSVPPPSQNASGCSRRRRAPSTHRWTHCRCQPSSACWKSWWGGAGGAGLASGWDCRGRGVRALPGQVEVGPARLGSVGLRAARLVTPGCELNREGVIMKCRVPCRTASSKWPSRAEQCRTEWSRAGV